jgi:predicted nucleic acid-binding protein
VIFVDTSFWIGMTIPRDDRHALAREVLERHAETALLTSNHVRGETWTLLRRRAGHSVATAFLDHLDEAARLRVVFVPEEVEADALRWLHRHDEREYSFVDATSFALMHKLGIRDAFAFDGDFAAAGFVELRA